MALNAERRPGGGAQANEVQTKKSLAAPEDDVAELSEAALEARIARLSVLAPEGATVQDKAEIVRELEAAYATSENGVREPEPSLDDDPDEDALELEMSAEERQEVPQLLPVPPVGLGRHDRREPFVQLPKRLHRDRDLGEISATDLFLITYLGLKGADLPDGVATTYEWLATAAERRDKGTIARRLSRLRERGYLDYELKPGQRTPFIVKLGRRAIPGRAPQPPARPPAPPAERLSTSGSTSGFEDDSKEEVTSDNTLPAGVRKPASAKGSTSGTTSGPSRACVETETETYDDVVVVDDHLRHLLAELGTFAPRQRDEIVVAHRENPAGLEACIEEARRGNNPPALLTELVRDRAHLNRRHATPEQRLERWWVSAGRHLGEDEARVVLEDSFRLAGEDIERELSRLRAVGQEPSG